MINQANLDIIVVEAPGQGRHQAGLLLGLLVLLQQLPRSPWVVVMKMRMRVTIIVATKVVAVKLYELSCWTAQ